MTIKATRINTLQGSFSVADVAVEVQREPTQTMVYPDAHAKAGEPVPLSAKGAALEDTHTFKAITKSKLVGKIVVEGETYTVEESLEDAAFTKEDQSLSGGDALRLARALAAKTGLTLDEDKE